jgi:hypothetical protein
MGYYTRLKHNFGSHAQIVIKGGKIVKDYQIPSYTGDFSDISEAISTYRDMVSTLPGLRVPESLEFKENPSGFTLVDEYIPGNRIQDLSYEGTESISFLAAMSEEIIQALVSSDTQTVPLDAAPSNFIIREEELFYVDFYPPLNVIKEDSWSNLRDVFFEGRSKKSLVNCFYTLKGKCLKCMSLIEKDIPELHDEILTIFVKNLVDEGKTEIADTLIRNARTGYSGYAQMKRM